MSPFGVVGELGGMRGRGGRAEKGRQPRQKKGAWVLGARKHPGLAGFEVIRRHYKGRQTERSRLRQEGKVQNTSFRFRMFACSRRPFIPLQLVLELGQDLF